MQVMRAGVKPRSRMVLYVWPFKPCCQQVKVNII